MVKQPARSFPDLGHAIGVENRVAADERDALDKCLRCQQAVERVAGVEWQAYLTLNELDLD